MKNNRLPIRIFYYFLHHIKHHAKFKIPSNLLLSIFLCGCAISIPALEKSFSNANKQAKYKEPETNFKAGKYHNCKITHLSDGDSFKIRCQDLANTEFKVRLAGIDAPEMGQAPWGEISKQYLHQLTAHKDLSIDIQNKDRYGRYLANLYDHSTDLAIQMVAAGKAIVYERYNKSPQYLQAQNNARQKKLGIWETSGAQQNPELWRRLNPRGS